MTTSGLILLEGALTKYEAKYEIHLNTFPTFHLKKERFQIILKLKK